MVKTEAQQSTVSIKSEPDPTATPSIAELIVPPRSCTIKKELEQLPTERAPTRKRIKREAQLVKEEPEQDELVSLSRKRVKTETATQEPKEPTKARTVKREPKSVKSVKAESVVEPKKEKATKAPVKRTKREPVVADPAREAKVAELSLRARQLLAEVYGYPKRGNADGVDAGDGCGAIRTGVLDSLVRTILSQNTTDATSAVAFANLKAVLPTWIEVLHAEEGVAEEAVRCGGLADVKMARVRTILTQILSERPEQSEPSLEFLHDWQNDDIKKYLGAMKGVGPKTISCVLMFTMGRAEFPVDTHVWKLAMKLGWVPKSASREVTYDLLNRMVPDQIKYDLHVLLVQHGKALKNELGVLKSAVR